MASNSTYFKDAEIVMKHKISSRTGLKRFQGLTGVSAIVFVDLMGLLLKSSNVSPKYVIWALFWLKHYTSENVAAMLFNTTEKTFREKVWAIVLAISELKLVDWDDRYQDWDRTEPCCSLDGTDCFINEHHPFDKDYGSHKMNHAALRYEIGLALGSSKIVWWNGGVPAGSNPDLSLARSSFVHMLTDDEMAIADKGYSDGGVHFLAPFRNPQTDQAKTFNRQHKKYMARHEMVNKRIKQFGVLRSWRHKGDSKHKTCFGAVINITQISFQYEPLPDLSEFLNPS